MAISTISGYPSIGKHRELKKALESYWSGKADQRSLIATGKELRRAHVDTLRGAQLDLIPVNDFTFYDRMLDMIALVGAVPDRFGWSGEHVDLDTYFAMARGTDTAPAMEMTKWFDTNYHYIVPELSSDSTFKLSANKPFALLEEAQQYGVGNTTVVLVGPITFLKLAKLADGSDPLALLERLLPVYEEIVSRLAEAGASWIQLDEPALVTGVDEKTLAALTYAYAVLGERKGTTRILLNTYIDHIADSWATLITLPIDGIGVDFVRGGKTIEAIREHGVPDDLSPFAGVVDGRNIWRNDLRTSLSLLQVLTEVVDKKQIAISTSCSLQHVPYDVDLETDIDPELRSWLAFANQKIAEVVTLARGFTSGEDEIQTELAVSDRVLNAARASSRRHNPDVKQRVSGLTAADADRGMNASERAARQAERFNLPPLPTTTIGSFPQSTEIRAKRRAFDKGEIDDAAYESFLKSEIERVIHLQVELGIDVLVHGEPERNDMVQYFGEQMAGFAFTHNGWVQSYGSRCVRPPIIYGDVSRPNPMTVAWAVYAQSLSDKPVKGMLTGPVTILNWSFVRNDQPREATCRQIALAIRDEVADLEAAGIAMIQIDEAALREGLPLRRENRDEYLRWAVDCFRLTSAIAQPETQIHTHMCYSEFNDIFQAISDLDADVISIENARSGLELLEAFRENGYDKGIGPGVYDIHSPRIPSVDEMVENLKANLTVLDVAQLWVNPDCGLKTRKEKESTAALQHMVEATRQVRTSIA